MPNDARNMELLAKQLVMNRYTWAELRKHGVTEQTRLRLDFTYSAPSRDAAEALRASLEEATDYDLAVRSDRSFLRRRWRVEGTTQQTRISPEILEKWVRWMFTAGIEHSCEFDGWGTSGPGG
jgi:Regulator of ribonuclease activity B